MEHTRLIHSTDIAWTKNPRYIDTWFNWLSTNEKFSVLARIESGGGQVPHAHPNEIEEVTYILEGQGLALVNGDWQPCTSGDCLQVAAGVEHCLKNAGSRPLFFLSSYHPPLP